MKKVDIAKIAIAIVSSISLITVMAISISGAHHIFTDDMIVTMEVVGGVGIAALIAQLAIAITALIKDKNGTD